MEGADSEYSENQDEKSEEADVELDPSNPDHAFAILEKDFNRTLAGIEQDPNTAGYAEEFNKLFEALYQSREREKELEQTHDRVSKELSIKTNQLSTALELADTDKNTIDDMKTQIENAWRLADAAHAREQAAREVIDNLRKQIENLNAEIDFRNRMAQETSEENVSEQKKEGLEREKEKLMGEVNQLTQKLTNALGYQEELERKNSVADFKIAEIAEKLEAQVQLTESGKAAYERLESEIDGLNSKIGDRDEVIDELNEQIKVLRKEIVILDAQIKDFKQEIDKVYKDYEHVNAKQVKLQDDLDRQGFQLSSLKLKYNEKVTDIKTAEDEVAHLKNDLARITKQRDVFEKKVMSLENEREDLVSDRNNLRQRVGMFERDIDDRKKEIDENKRTIEVYKKEKDVLSKSLQRSQAVLQDQILLSKVQIQGKKKLEVELDMYFIEGNKQKKMISNLERERDRLSEEQLNLKKKIEESLDEIKLKKTQIYDLKKSLAEQTVQIRMQQNVFESLRAEKNAVQKLLQESNAECSELKKKLKITSHQAEQLKEDIAMKEQLLVKEENILRKVMKEKENLRVEVDNAIDHIKTLKEEIAEMLEEEKRLHKVIHENDRTIRQQVQDLEQLMNERDILGSQLVRRNDEIALLHEKIVILETTLHRGEAQYDQRLEDIRLLKIEIKRLRQEKNLMSKSMNNMVDLRQEVFHLERDLTKARLKCRALEEEVQNPLNIHRWRKLEGSDPGVMDLLQKTQMLQKRLLQQTSEAVERERQLKEVENLYMSLRQVLAKQPGPGIQEQLNKTQRALKLRGNKLKCLVSELNMTELQAAEFKSDLQRVSDELLQMKQKYLEERRAHQTLRMQLQSSKEINRTKRASDTVKFTGGGYRMSVQSVMSNN